MFKYLNNVIALHDIIQYLFMSIKIEQEKAFVLKLKNEVLLLKVYEKLKFDHFRLSVSTIHIYV